jgi:LPS-assembly protein
MLKSGASLIPPLLFLTIGNLTAQMPSDPGVLPAVDTITPVPAPDIGMGSPGALEPVMPTELKINNQGGRIEGNIETGLRLGGPVKIEGDNGMEIFSDTAVLDLKAKTVTLSGNVTVYQGNLMQRGDRAVYHYERKFLDSSGLRASLDPILMESGKFTAEQRGDRQVFVGHDAGITTHDVENPNYWVRAEARPRSIRARKSSSTTCGFTPETRRSSGCPISPSRWMRSSVIISFPVPARTGDPSCSTPTASCSAARPIRIPAKTWMHGCFPAGTSTSAPAAASAPAWTSWTPASTTAMKSAACHCIISTTSIPGNPAPACRADSSTRTAGKRSSNTATNRSFPDDADWWFDTNLTWLSDRHYLEDFEIDRYRTDPAPDNTLGLYRRDDASLLSLYARYQINDFYRADSRLPELTYDRVRAPLFGLPVLHEGTTSVGYIGEKAADVTRNAIINPLMGMTTGSPEAPRLLQQLGGYERRLAESLLACHGDPRRDSIRTQLLDSNYGRFHTYQEWSLPMLLGGFLSVTPEPGPATPATARWMARKTARTARTSMSVWKARSSSRATMEPTATTIGAWTGCCT